MAMLTMATTCAGGGSTSYWLSSRKPLNSYARAPTSRRVGCSSVMLLAALAVLAASAVLAVLAVLAALAVLAVLTVPTVRPDSCPVANP